MNTTKELERITLEAIRKFQTLNAERQKVMLKKMDEFIESEKSEDIKSIFIKLKAIFVEASK
jgi:hypothetical protein